ncbi:N-acetyl-D-glucosamine kinase N-acetylglucosamine kinase [Proteiniborus sp. DW1]|uniref:BadF/BadG/BcrA/BcrD ATPase family protein n=1 Tax=Proteiniborus sp. DW1 TaxID=1889883 RepID=UPI00092E011F|nr:BadF/BadG/BcrA/BcrD ATPase family protein [Proteiniborus sp. DW1]SCG82026.1 N-acetyl-D-glucosamine kinase N-acetylglucosamine kinase [Proteiniborus sp. DW1]
MSKIKVGLIGAGQRGKDVYGNYALIHPEHIEFVAVAEPNEIKRKEFSEKHNIKPEYQFESWEEFFEKEKFCDAVIIATPDRVHFEPAKLALEKNYHILLEKPMSNDPKEVMELGKLAEKNDKVFMICHVLRYTPFFSTIKSIIDSGEIGDIMSIQHNENIGYFHFGHSFVRGNWRNSDLSSPLMLQKSCHDMDILLWLVGADCTKIASFGELSYFKKESKPENAGDRCVNCQIENQCPYSAVQLYYNNVGRWPTTAICEIQTIEEVKKAVAEGPYGRCVYECDNNVVDHQSTILEFANNVTATFNLSAFTNKVMGKLLGHAVKPTCHYKQTSLDKFEQVISEGIEEVCRQSRISISEIDFSVIGIPGYGEIEKDVHIIDETVKRILGKNTFRCVNDAVVAWAGSLGCKAGINIVAGTGAIGYGIDPKGNMARSSGWGPFCGDEGSAYWLGKKVIETFSKQSDGRLKKTPLYDIVSSEFNIKSDFDLLDIVVNKMEMKRDKVAQLAKLLYRAAKVNDEFALEAYIQAAYEHYSTIHSLIEKLDFKNEERILVSYSGGVFNAGKYILDSLKILLKKESKPIELITPILKPVFGAALYALTIKLGKQNADIIENLITEQAK